MKNRKILMQQAIIPYVVLLIPLLQKKARYLFATSTVKVAPFYIMSELLSNLVIGFLIAFLVKINMKYPTKIIGINILCLTMLLFLPSIVKEYNVLPTIASMNILLIGSLLYAFISNKKSRGTY